jgi:hypothetical protein
MTMTAAAKPSSVVIRRLYRNLLRSAKPFTSPSPNARVLNCLLHRTGIDDHINDWEAFVSAVPEKESHDNNQARDLSVSYNNKDAGQGGNEVIPPNQTYQRLFRRLLREVVTVEGPTSNGFRKLNWPSQVDPNNLREVIRREFRDKTSSQSIHFGKATRRQVAFTALREVNKKLFYFDQLQESSPEPVPQQAAWHVSPLPFSPSSSYLRPGAFLVSHPHMNDSFFTKTVICILEHKEDCDSDDDSDDDDSDDDESAAKQSEFSGGQTYGLVVNQVSVNNDTGKNRTLKEAFEQHMLPGRLADVFGDSVVREGGPVHVAVQMLHSLPATTDDDDDADDDEEGDEDSSIGGRLIPTIPEGDSTSMALYSDRATYFQGDIFKAMNAVEDSTMDRGT